MSRPFLLLLCTFCLVSLVNSATIAGSVGVNSILTDVRRLRPTTKVVLNGGLRWAVIKANGQFELTNVEPGTYLLEVQSIDYVFPRLRVDVGPNDDIRAAYTGLGVDWEKPGYPVDHPLELKAKAVANYFAQHQRFNVFGLFKNPMFLMIGLSAVMMLVLPKMLASMDPETLKEMSQSQSDAQKAMSDMPSLSQIFANAQAAAQQQQQQRRR